MLLTRSFVSLDEGPFGGDDEGSSVVGVLTFCGSVGVSTGSLLE